MSDHKEMLEVMQQQVGKLLLEHQPKFQNLMNDIEAQLGNTPISIRLMMYEIILCDLLGKIVASGTIAFQYDTDKMLEGFSQRLRQVSKMHIDDIQKNGGLNVHANSVGDQVPSDGANSGDNSNI